MSSGLYAHTTRAVGTVLTAAIYNSDHTNHILNANPSMHGGFSDNVAEMQLTSDPGEVGTEMLAASMADELRRLRFIIREITGETHWYETPIASLSSLGGSADQYVASRNDTGINLGARRFIASAVAPDLVFDKSRHGTIGSFTILQNDDGLGRILFRGSDADSFVNGAYIEARVRGTPASEEMPTSIYFFTSPGAGGPLGRLELGPDGTLNLPNKSAPTIILNPDGSMHQTSFHSMVEMAAPTTPGANILRMYASDDGAGVTRLRFIDSAGSIRQLAFSSELPAAVPAATEVEVEAGTEAAKYLSPLTGKFLGGVVKAWWRGTDDTLTAGHNVASVLTSGANTTITFTENMANTTYIALCWLEDFSLEITPLIPSARAVGSCAFLNTNTTKSFFGFVLGVLD